MKARELFARCQCADRPGLDPTHPKHRLLPLDFGFEEVMGWCTGGLLGHRQVTDAWLLALAIRHKVKQERQQHLSILD